MPAHLVASVKLDCILVQDWAYRFCDSGRDDMHDGDGSVARRRGYSRMSRSLSALGNE